MRIFGKLLAAIVLSAGFAWPLRAAQPPVATEANLIPEVQELASLMAEEQHSADLEGGVKVHPICGRDEKGPDCRTLVLFNVGNYMGNSVTQYLAIFDPVDADSDYADLPDVVKHNSKYRPWKFISVIAIDTSDEVYATFDDCKYIDNMIELQGLAHGPKDSNAEYSRKVSIHVTLDNDVLTKVSIFD